MDLWYDACPGSRNIQEKLGVNVCSSEWLNRNGWESRFAKVEDSFGLVRSAVSKCELSFVFWGRSGMSDSVQFDRKSINRVCVRKTRVWGPRLSESPPVALSANPVYLTQEGSSSRTTLAVFF